MKNQRLSVAVVMLVCAAALANCSNRAIYETVQQNQLRRCEEIPIPQQANCREQFQTSFEEYTRERNELSKETQP
ncbi:MAG: hypothetical protein MI746_04045 [Pseudomonadales bacterium]|nr:hypothetical protein [Pseudomonadales bacterium]